MDLLKKAIRERGVPMGSGILLVDSFLNHQIDIPLMREIGREFKRLFAEIRPTRVVTIESSGIAPAMATAEELQLPLLVMKKQASGILSEELLQTPVASFTKGGAYQLTVKRKYLAREDRVLIIDDFLANGEAALGAVKLVEAAGASVAGIGIVIEKAFQPGKKRLAEAGYGVRSLAAISQMAEGEIVFEGDE